MLVCCLHVPTVCQRTAVSKSVVVLLFMSCMACAENAHAKCAESAYIGLRRISGYIPAIFQTQTAACLPSFSALQLRACTVLFLDSTLPPLS